MESNTLSGKSTERKSSSKTPSWALKLLHQSGLKSDAIDHPDVENFILRGRISANPMVICSMISWFCRNPVPIAIVIILLQEMPVGIKNLILEDVGVLDEHSVKMLHFICRHKKNGIDRLALRNGRFNRFGLRDFPDVLHSMAANLISLEISDFRLGEEGGIIILNAIRKAGTLFSKLATLDLHNNKISAPHENLMSDAFISLPALEELNISQNRLVKEDLKSFHKFLQLGAKLRLLDLSQNKIGDVQGAIVIGALLSHPTLCVLRMNSCKLGANAGTALNALIAMNKKLFELEVRDNKLNAYLSMAKNNSLIRLDVSFNSFGDELMQGFLTELKDNETLRSLSIGRTKMGKASIAVLGNVLKIHRTIEVIDINSINEENSLDKEIFSLFETLSDNKTKIKSLDLSNNGIQEVPSLLKKNTNLSCLVLRSNPLSPRAYETIASLMRSSRNIATINLDKCPHPGSDCIQPIIEAIKANCSVRQLFLNMFIRPGTSHPEMIELIHALNSNTHLVDLRVGTQGEERELEALSESMQSNSTLINSDLVNDRYLNYQDSDLKLRQLIMRNFRRNICFESEGLAAYLHEAILRFAESTDRFMKVRDLGEPLWIALWDKRANGRTMAALRAAINASAVSRHVRGLKPEAEKLESSYCSIM